MILGHNGSGKSSIICGICLACGGSPKSLGRSERIVEYIRHGCTEGYVEIAIADKQKGPQVVRLTIRVGEQPKYRLNDSATTQSEIADLRKHYNIQIDNPCAFLAQDKVKSFSEQSSIELLRNTEKAASADLDQQHIDLMKQREDSTSIEDKCTTSENAIKRLEDEIGKIMPLVENYRKKLALQSKLRLLEKKMKIMEFEKFDREYKAELQNMDGAMIEYREVEKSIAECEKHRKNLEDRIKKDRSQISQMQRSCNEILAKVQEKGDKKLMEDMMQRAKAKLESAKKAADQHEKDVEKARKMIDQARARLQEAVDTLNGYEEFQSEMKSLEQKYSTAERDSRQEEDAIQKKSYEMRQLENKKRDEEQNSQLNRQDRYRVLQNFSSDASKAYRWYQQNRSQFKGDVYMPIMDMVLKTPEAAKALENSVGVRDRTMFVCCYKEDELLINGKQHSWRINTSVVPAEKIYSEDIDAQLPSELSRLGFKYLVSNCFDAPAPLKQFLCNVSGLNRIPFGGSDVEKKIAEVSQAIEQTRYSVFLTANIRCQNSKSRYANNTLQSQSATREANTWRDQFFKVSPVAKRTDNSILEEIQKLKAEIDIRSEQLREKRGAIQKERDVLRQEQMQWKSKKQVHTKWKTELASEMAKLEALENEVVDISAIEEEYANVEKKAILETKKMLENSIRWHKEIIDKHRLIGIFELSESICKSRVNKSNSEAETHRSKLEDLKSVKDAAEDLLKTALNHKKAAASALMKECSLKTLDESKMSPAENKIYSSLVKMFEEADVPTDMNTLDQAITSEKTRLKLAEDSGEDGSIVHEQRLKVLDDDLVLEKTRQEKLIENRARIHDKLGDEINNWRKEVETMIEQINVNYVQFFDSLGCRGEVSLEVPENPLDIEKYGIMIMVCFRKGESMKRLDNKVQSGGERSVATMLYLLALQQLCPVPFRCIDEINQGMDPTNERKVFDIMVGMWNGTTGTLSKTQYFLLSPKLLHGLDMRENVNIVMVNSTLTNSHGKHYDTSAKIDATFAKMGISA